MVTVYASIPDTNGDINVFYTDDDEYCACNCHKYTCTPNPDTYYCEHCHPDEHAGSAHGNASASQRPLHGPRP